MTERIQDREREFHDEWADSIDPTSIDVEGNWSGAGVPECAWIAEQLGALEGLKLLELGTGAGEGAVFFAMRGADVTATDISPGMLEVASKVASHHGVSIRTTVADAADLSQFDDDSFDIVYGANVLHHVDLDQCLGEVQRVLKPGGRAAFWDPVLYNPAIQIYRRLAADVRTDDEHPLRRRDLQTFGNHFATVRTQAFWLTGLTVFARFFFVDRIKPSSERYWKLVVERQDELEKPLRRYHKIDQQILKRVGPLRWMCWNMAVIATTAGNTSNTG